MADELVNKGEYKGVGRGDDVETATWREGDEDAGGEEEEEERSGDNIPVHLFVLGLENFTQTP